MSISRHHEAKQWLKNLPSGWRIVTVKQCAEITYGFPADSESFTTDPDYIPLIRIRDITSGNIQTYYSGTYPRESLINDEDVLIGMDGDFNLRVWAGGQALLNQRCCRVAGNTPEVTKFLSYTLPYALTEIHNLTLSTTVKHLLADGIEKALLPLPDSTEELRAIVSVLDAETFKIDRAVDLLRQQLEVLELIKKSLIYEAVTKGLDPSVLMKPSGVEWIGDIPQHWQIRRLKYVAELGSGTTPNSGNIDFYEPGEIPWIQSGDLYRTDKVFKTEKLVTRKALRDVPSLSLYRAPFVAVAMYGASIGNTALSQIDACLNQACCKVSPRDSHDCTFFFYAIRASKDELLSKAQGGTQPNISQIVIKNHPIPIPPAPEQHAIAAYLDEQYTRLAESITLKQKQIELLQEQRKSFIFEYVTGKRRVSGVA